MRSKNLILVMLLAIFSISQLGATGFVPNMFVAQKKLNKVTCTTTTSQSEAKKQSVEAKEKSKEASAQSDKKLSGDYLSESGDSVELESAATRISSFIFKWVVSYLTMGRMS